MVSRVKPVSAFWRPKLKWSPKLKWKELTDEIEANGFVRIEDQGIIERRPDGLYAVTPEGVTSGPVTTVVGAMRRLAKLPRPVMLGGVDALAWVEKLREITVLGGVGPIDLRVTSDRPRHDGFAVFEGGTRTICLMAKPGLTPAWVVATILHELVHLSGCWRHDRPFKHRFIAAVAEAFPEAGMMGLVRSDLSVEALDDVLTGAIAWALYRRGEIKLSQAARDVTIGFVARLIRPK